jgi:5-methylcytosine-specific restriction endonuclease McrA
MDKIPSTLNIAWNNFKRQFKMRYHPLSCAICDSIDKREFHHIKPFSEDHTLFTDLGNIMILCRNCHFHYGHLGNWQNHNPDIKEKLQDYRKEVLKDKYVFKVPKYLESL